MAILSTALTVAKFIPDVLKLFSKDDEAVVAEKVVDIAGTVLGVPIDNIESKLENDPQAIVELKKALLADKWVQQRLDLENVKDARSMYKVHNEQADKIADSIINLNLLYVALLCIVNLGVLYFFQDNAELMLFVGNLIGGVIMALLKERQDIVNFYHGSSMGSKQKSLINGDKRV